MVERKNNELKIKIEQKNILLVQFGSEPIGFTLSTIPNNHLTLSFIHNQQFLPTNPSHPSHIQQYLNAKKANKSIPIKVYPDAKREKKKKTH